MASSIDDKVVSLRFDNAQFEAKIASTVAALDQLSQKIQTVGAGGQGFKQVADAANAVNLSGIAAGVENVSSKFTALGAIAFSTLQKLTQNILSFAGQWVQTDILEPLITGGKTRAQNIEQAQFQFRGLGMDVNQVMADAKSAVLGTAYGLGDAAKAAAQFGASGITAGDDMRQSLRAIAGTAAMTGSNFADMAYLFTSSAAIGKITNMDFQQFATRGLNAAAAYGKAIGKSEAEVHAMATAGTIDYKSFAKAMDDTFGEHATKANETYAGSLANMHAAMSRLSASFFGPQMQQQRDLFNALTPAIDKTAAALKPLIDTMLQIRGVGVENIIGAINKLNFDKFKESVVNFADAFKNSWAFIQQLLTVVRVAFNDIFPQSAIDMLLQFSKAIKDFTDNLMMSAGTMNKVRSIFDGFFSIFAIGWEIIKGFVTMLGEIIKAVAPASGTFLSAGASVGDFITHLKEILVDGGKIHDFFVALGNVIVDVINFITEIEQKIVSFFSVGSGGEAISGAFQRIDDRIQSVSGNMDWLSAAWEHFANVMQPIVDALGKLWDYISNWFSELGQKIADVMQPSDFNNVLDIINVGLLAGIAVMLQKFFAGGVKFGFGGGFITTLKNSLMQVNNSLKLMQTNLKAQALLKIAAALAIIAGAVLVLSMINSAALTKALAAMAVGFGQLAAMLVVLDKSFSSIGGAAKMAVISGSMIAMATAMLIMSAAVKVMSSMSAGELTKGLIGIAVSMGILVAAINLMPDTLRLMATGLAMQEIAFALIILSKAVKDFSDMSWGQMAKGLIGVAVGLGLIVAAMNLMPPTSVLTGLAFIAVAAGLKILASAVKDMGDLNWGEIGRGLTTLAGSLVAIVAAMNLMPPDLPLTATGLILVGAALKIIVSAVKDMGDLKWGEIGKGLLTMAGTLAILVVAMNAMTTGLAGAAATVVISSALVILAGVIERLGKMPLKEIAIGVGAIAGTLLVLGGTAAILQPVIPALLGLGVAIGVLGTGIALFGAAAFLFASAMQIMAVAGVAGTTALVKSIEILLKELPKIAAGMALFFVNFAEEILKASPTVLKLMGALIEQLCETVIKEAPKIGKALVVMIREGLKVIREVFPDLVTTGFLVLTTFLEALKNNIGQLTTTGIEIIIKFIEGITSKLPDLVSAAVNLIVTFCTELGKHAGELIAAGVGLLVKLLEGLGSQLDTIVGAVLTFLWNLAQAFAKPEHIQKMIDIGVMVIGTILQVLGGTIKGIVPYIVTFLWNLAQAFVQLVDTILQIGEYIIIKILEGAATITVDFLRKCADVLIAFLNGLAQAIRDKDPEIKAAGQNLAGAILDAVGLGFLNPKKSWKDRMWDAGKMLFAGLAWAVGAGSPAKKFIPLGDSIAQGVGLGLSRNEDATRSAVNLAKRVHESLQNALAQLPNNLDQNMELYPKITPVMDLTRVQSGAGDIQNLLNGSNLSLQQAKIISAQAAAATATNVPPTTPTPTKLEFNQTINAPEALSTNDIYRGTKSQLALAKKELDI